MSDCYAPCLSRSLTNRTSPASTKGFVVNHSHMKALVDPSFTELMRPRRSLFTSLYQRRWYLTTVIAIYLWISAHPSASLAAWPWHMTLYNYHWPQMGSSALAMVDEMKSLPPASRDSKDCPLEIRYVLEFRVLPCDYSPARVDGLGKFWVIVKNRDTRYHLRGEETKVPTSLYAVDPFAMPDINGSVSALDIHIVTSGRTRIEMIGSYIAISISSLFKRVISCPVPPYNSSKWILWLEFEPYLGILQVKMSGLCRHLQTEARERRNVLEL